jgi:hypothetical protein
LNTSGLFAIVVAALASAACGSSSETITAPSQSRCSVRAQAEGLSFTPDGGPGVIRVTSNRECLWTARSDAAWVALLPPASGQGDGSIQFTVAANNDPDSRTGGIAVEDQRLQVSQEGKPCEFRLSTTLEMVVASGGELTVQVVASSPQCRWTATVDVPWITILSGREASGNGAVTFRVDAVTGPQRAGSLTIAGQTVRVEQGTGCSYVVATTELSFGAAGGRADVPVSAPEGCSWSAQSGVPWITLLGGSSGSGSGLVVLRVDASDGPPRTGAVTVAGKLVTVTQSQGCSYIVDPTTYSVPSSGGSSAATVRAAAGCTWTASSSSDWISVTAGQSGNGTGEVRFTVAANPGPARTAGLRIADHTLTVNQGSGCSFGLSPSSVSVGAAAGSGAIQVSTASGCTWSATSSASWLSIVGASSGSGNGQVQFQVAANSGPAREGSLSIGGGSVSVSQASGCTYSIAPSGQEVPGTGGTGTASITTAAGCPWTASSGAEWITLSAQSGTGPSQVPFTVAPNLGPARSGTLTLAGHLFTVTQTSQCTWTFVPPTHVYDSNGGNGAVLVIVSGPCTWTAASNVDWITVTSGASGTGGGVVQFSVAPNTGPARAGSLTIAAQRYDVTQGGR